MRPPICAVCGVTSASVGSSAHFELVYVADYQSRPGPGHPPGMEWFCQVHVMAAQRLSHLCFKDVTIELSGQFADPAQARKVFEREHPREKGAGSRDSFLDFDAGKDNC
jgi:hypothetical protein